MGVEITGRGLFEDTIEKSCFTFLVYLTALFKPK
jgi:hypothetical protein